MAPAFLSPGGVVGTQGANQASGAAFASAATHPGENLLHAQQFEFGDERAKVESCCTVVVPSASPKSGEHSEFRVTTVHAEPLRKSTHFLHQYTSPFTTLPSVLFYKEGLYISMQHRSKH
jgi:hypothetical protein